MDTQLPAEVFKVNAAVDAPDIEEHLINGILFHARRQLFQMCHYPGGHRGVKLIVAGEHVQLLGKLCVLQPEPRYAHFDTKKFCFF